MTFMGACVVWSSVELAGRFWPESRPNIGTRYADLALPEPLVLEVGRPGTRVALDRVAYTTFLKESGLTEGVLVVWVQGPNGVPIYHAIRPLDDPGTFSGVIQVLPTLLPGRSRPSGSFQRTRPHVWPVERLQSRAAAEVAIGQGTAAGLVVGPLAQNP
ncbi:MAG: hypothetical protein AB7I30_23515 [Isosphaeraceae bacterium]